MVTADKLPDSFMTDSEAIVQLVIEELFDDLVMDKVATQTYTRKELLPILDRLELRIGNFIE
jgi:hypothetical protein